MQTDMMEKWLKVTMFSVLNQSGKEIRNKPCDWLILQLTLTIPIKQFTQATESEATSEEKGNILIPLRLQKNYCDSVFTF